MGIDVFSPEGHMRMAAALADLYSHPLLDPEFVAQTRVARDRGWNQLGRPIVR